MSFLYYIYTFINKSFLANEMYINCHLQSLEKKVLNKLLPPLQNDVKLNIGNGVYFTSKQFFSKISWLFQKASNIGDMKRKLLAFD